MEEAAEEVEEAVEEAVEEPVVAASSQEIYHQLAAPPAAAPPAPPIPAVIKNRGCRDVMSLYRCTLVRREPKRAKRARPTYYGGQ